MTLEQLSINFSGRGTRQQAQTLSDKLTRIPRTDPLSRSRHLSHLAITLVEMDPARAKRLARESYATSLDANDEPTRALALIAQSVVDLGPDSLDNRLEWAETAIGIAVTHTNAQLAGAVFFLFLGALAEAGNLSRLDRELSHKHTSLKSLDALLESRHAAWFRCMRATLDGRANEAEALAAEGHRLAVEVQDPDADTVFIGQIAVIRWLQGRTDELEPALSKALRSFPDEPVWQSALAWVWFRQKRNSAATAIIDEMHDVCHAPRDRNWLASVAILAEVAAVLGPTHLVKELYSTLTPFDGRIVTIGLGVTAWGTVSRPLALLARRLGRDDEAEWFFRKAIGQCSEMGAKVWLAESQHELAEFLWDNNTKLEEARDLALEAVTAVHRVGPHMIEFPARRLLQQLNRRLVAEGSFVHGDNSLVATKQPVVWVFGSFRAADVEGKPIAWRSKKAQQLLKILIARRGAPVHKEHLCDLMWPGENPLVLNNRFSVALSTVRRLLDPQKIYAHSHFIQLDAGFVSLQPGKVLVDGETFLQSARLELEAAMHRLAEGRTASAIEFHRISELLDTVTGEVFPNEPVVSWADRLRGDIENRFSELSHLLARESVELGDHQRAGELYLRLIETDMYDQSAHEGLISSLTALGFHGQAQVAEEEAQKLLTEIGITLR